MAKIYTLTGATGLVGGHLCQRLLQEETVQIRVLHRAQSDLGRLEKILAYYQADSQKAMAKIEFRETDFEDIRDLESALMGSHQLFHCAATVSFSPRDRDALLYQNPALTRDLVNLSLALKIEKFNYVSSVAALGRGPGQEDFDENSHWINSKSNSLYARGKYAAELEVWRGQEEGLSVVIVNPSIILGPGDWTQGSSAIFPKIAKGNPFYPTGVNGFVDVRDVAELLVQLAQSELSGERFVLCAENWSYRDVFSTIAQNTGAKPPTYPLKNWMLSLAWRWEYLRSSLTGKNPFITRSTAHTAQNVYRYHSDKLKKQLAFRFRLLEQSIEDFSRFYRQDHPKS